MLGSIFRVLWRLFVFAVGLLSAWVIFKLYPYADRYFPVYIVILLIYCVVAYLIIPALIRLFRVVIKPDHIPLYVTTRDGLPSDPVNLAIVARNKTQLRRAMKRAGWYEADPSTLKNSLREAASILFNRAYPQAPVSTLYLFNRRHDIAFQIPTNPNQSARTRHHVRFWELTEPPLAHNDHQHFNFWSKQLRKFIAPTGRSIWIGAATEDSHPIGIRRTGTFTHRISHDANAERDFIIQTLRDSRDVARISSTKRGEQVKFRGQQFRTEFISDGSLKVVELKTHRLKNVLTE